MSSKHKGEHDYIISLSEDSFIVSDSIRSSLPDEFFQDKNADDEVQLNDSSETQVHLVSDEETHTGKLLSFECQSSQTVLYFEMRKLSALQLISGKRFKTITVRHDDVDLWVEEDIPKLKDTVAVDLNGPEAFITLTVRKIAMPGRHK